MPIAPPEPQLGPVRFVVTLPVGAGRALSFDGLGVELGNGWFDTTRRIAGAEPYQWGPLPQPVPELGDELLHDRGRRLFYPLQQGDLMRDSVRALAKDYERPAYWIWYAGSWHAVRVLPLQLPVPKAA